MSEIISGLRATYLLEKDIYFAMPQSIPAYLTEHYPNLNLSDRVILERLISFSFQRFTRRSNTLTARIARSVLHLYTGISIRTITQSIGKLIELGLIKMINRTKKGTLYAIQIPFEAMKNIKHRFKKEEPTPTIQLSSADIDSTKTPPPHSTTNASDNHQLSKIKEEIEKVESIIKELSDSIPNRSDFDSVKSYQFAMSNLTPDQNSTLNKIGEYQSKRETLASEYKTASTSQPTFKDKNEEVSNEPNKKSYKTRDINKNLIQFFKKKLAELDDISVPAETFKEAIWAITKGVYAQRTDISIFHSFNIVKNLIKGGYWRTPYAYNPAEAEFYLLVKGVK